MATMLKKFKQATVNDYIEWLKGFLALGYNPTHYYAYNMHRSNFLIAQDNFKLGGECGTRSRSIIVPKGIKWLGGDLGHNELYFMDKFETKGYWVPIYIDEPFIDLNVSFINRGIVRSLYEHLKYSLDDGYFDIQAFKSSYESDLNEAVDLKVDLFLLMYELIQKEEVTSEDAKRVVKCYSAMSI